MKKSKIIVIIILMLVLIMFALIGVFAYTMFYTDALKTDKQLFFKYMSKNNEVIENLKDENYKAYLEKQKNTPYTEEGQIKATRDNESTNSNQQNNLGNTSLTYVGSVDKSNNYDYKKIKLNYSDTQSTGFEYFQKQDVYGIKIDNILKKYLSIKNDNLKQVAQNLGLSEEALNVIPNKISKISFEKIFTKEIEDKYKDIIYNYLNDEMFTKQENAENTVYTMTIKASDVKNLGLTCLQTIQDDEQLLNNIKSIMISDFAYSEEEANKSISELESRLEEFLEDYNENDNSADIVITGEEANEEVNETNASSEENEENIVVNLYVQNSELQKTEIIIDEYSISTENTTNGMNIKFTQNDANEQPTTNTINIEKTKSEDELVYNITLTSNSQNINIKKTLKGINTLNQVEETSEYDVTSNGTNFMQESGKSQTAYTIKKTFLENITQENITEQDVVLLNNYSLEQMQNVFSQISTRYTDINYQYNLLTGLPEDENLLLYYYLPSFIDIQFLGSYGGLTVASSSGVFDTILGLAMLYGSGDMDDYMPYSDEDMSDYESNYGETEGISGYDTQEMNNTDYNIGY